MQLGDAEAVCVENDHFRCIGNIDTHLDHRGRHEDIGVPGAESIHHFFLLARLHPTVKKVDGEIGKFLGTQKPKRLLSRRQLESLIVFDERTYDVRLSTSRDLLTNMVPDVDLSVSIRHTAGENRSSTSWLLVQHADVQVSVHGHRSGPRNRSGGHDENVGNRATILTLGSQSCALLDAEAVLLIHHHDAEIRELDRLLNQSVCSDHHIDRAIGDAGKNVASSLSGNAAGEKLHSQWPLPEKTPWFRNHHSRNEVRHSRKVLLRKDFGRSHECTLISTLNRHQEGGHGNHCLSRSHISLQETVHRVRTCEVAFDFGNDACLCTRERIRQSGMERSNEITVDDVANPHRVTFEGSLAHHQDELDSK